jgi:epsin
MDFDNIKKQVSNLTLYDIKAGVRKMQNGRLPSAPLPREPRVGLPNANSLAQLS